jgi:TatD DNase family protein
LIDAHAHLSAGSISGVVHEVIGHLRASGLQHIVLGGVDPADWRRQLELGRRYREFLTTAAGIHPWVVRDADEGVLATMFEDLSKMATQFDLIGEVGFDFYKDNSHAQKLKQRHWCERQLDLCSSLGKPVVLHVVRGHDQMLEALNNFDGIRGILHAFNGSDELARQYVRRGFILSLGQRFFRQKKASELAWLRGIPFVLESDAPHYNSEEKDPHTIARAWMAELEESAKSLSEALAMSELDVWSKAEHHLNGLLTITKSESDG